MYDSLVPHSLVSSLQVKNTLTSLYDLINSQQHMPVEDIIGNAVSRAVEHYHRTIASAASSELGKGVLSSRVALGDAKFAFFHSSMLPVLHFPSEHLYAVFAPMFVPTVLPVFKALISYIKEKRRKKT